MVRKPTKHAPKGFEEGGQFIGKGFVGTPLIRALLKLMAGEKAKPPAKPVMRAPSVSSRGSVVSMRRGSKAVAKFAPAKKAAPVKKATPRATQAEIDEILNSGMSDEGKRRTLTGLGVPQSKWPKALRPAPTPKPLTPTDAERRLAGYPDPQAGVSDEAWMEMSYDERLRRIVAARPVKKATPAKKAPAKAAKKAARQDLTQDRDTLRSLLADVPGRTGQRQVTDDPVLHRIAERQGWLGHPRRVDKATFDRMLADGQPEMWRGVEDQDVADSLVAGDLYYGGSDLLGELGGGIPTASDRPNARMYGPHLTRMTLAPGSRVIDLDDLQDEFDAWRADFGPGDRLGPDDQRLAGRDGFGDLSRFAAARGYDAVRIDPGEDMSFDPDADPEWLEVLAGQYGIDASELTQRDIDELRDLKGLEYAVLNRSALVVDVDSSDLSPSVKKPDAPVRKATKAAPAGALVSVTVATRRLPSGPDVLYHSGAENLDLDREIFLAPTVTASSGYLQGGSGTITAFRLRPDARLADEDDIQRAADEALGDVVARFGYQPYVYELADMPEVRRQLSTDGFAGASYRDLGPDNRYQHDTTVVWDRAAVEVLGRQNVAAKATKATAKATKATPSAGAVSKVAATKAPTRTALAAQLADNENDRVTAGIIRDSRGNTDRLRVQADVNDDLASALDRDRRLRDVYAKSGRTPALLRERASRLRDAADRIEAESASTPARAPIAGPSPTLTYQERLTRRVLAGFSERPTEAETHAALDRLSVPQLRFMAERLGVVPRGRSVRSFSRDGLKALIYEEVEGGYRRRVGTGGTEQAHEVLVDASLDIKPPAVSKVAPPRATKAQPPSLERADIKEIADRLPESRRAGLEQILTNASPVQRYPNLPSKAAAIRGRAATLRRMADDAYRANPRLQRVIDRKRRDEAIAEHLDRIADLVYPRPGTQPSRGRLPEIRETLDDKVSAAGVTMAGANPAFEIIRRMMDDWGSNDAPDSLRSRATEMRERATEMRQSGERGMRLATNDQEREQAQSRIVGAGYLQTAADVFDRHAADVEARTTGRSGGSAVSKVAGAKVTKPPTPRGRRVAPWDPYPVYVDGGEPALRDRLLTLDLEQLQDMIADHGMDPARRATKWQDRDRLIELIVGRVRDRASKGQAFRTPRESIPNTPEGAARYGIDVPGAGGPSGVAGARPAKAAAKVAKPPAVAGSPVEGRSLADLRAIAKDEGIPLPKQGTREQLAQTIRDFRFTRDRDGGKMVFATQGGELTGGAPTPSALGSVPRYESRRGPGGQWEVWQIDPNGRQSRVETLSSEGAANRRAGALAELAERRSPAVAKMTPGPATPSPAETARLLNTTTSEDEGRAALAAIRSKPDLQALAREVGVEYTSRDSIAGLRSAILRQVVTRRLEHDAYMRRARPAAFDVASPAVAKMTPSPAATKVAKAAAAKVSSADFDSEDAVLRLAKVPAEDVADALGGYTVAQLRRIATEANIRLPAGTKGRDAIVAHLAFALVRDRGKFTWR